MKQVTILCKQAGTSCGGLNEILREREVFGTTSWAATIVFEDEMHVHEEISQGNCQNISMIVPDESVAGLAQDLVTLNQRLMPGNKFMFWFTDITNFYAPWEK